MHIPFHNLFLAVVIKETNISARGLQFEVEHGTLLWELRGVCNVAQRHCHVLVLWYAPVRV